MDADGREQCERGIVVEGSRVLVSGNWLEEQTCGRLLPSRLHVETVESLVRLAQEQCRRLLAWLDNRDPEMMMQRGKAIHKSVPSSCQEHGRRRCQEPGKGRIRCVSATLFQGTPGSFTQSQTLLIQGELRMFGSVKRASGLVLSRRTSAEIAILRLLTRAVKNASSIASAVVVSWLLVYFE